MRKVLSLSLITALLIGCQTTNNKENIALKKEIENLKKVQRQVAIKVGLGALVRPEKIELSTDGIWIGSPSTDIVMIEFTDLNCPFCKQFQQTVWPSLKKEFVDTNQIAVLARELPLTSIHPKAPFAAVMLRCANEQEQYGPVKEKLFELGNSLNKENISEIVEEFELDGAEYDNCITDTNVHNVVTKSIAQASELGLIATPSFIIGKREGKTIVNYTLLSGAGSLEEFSAAIAEVKANK